MSIKANPGIITDPRKFKKTVLAQIPPSMIDSKFEGIFNILLYYIWQGIQKTRTAMLENNLRMDLGSLCVGTFISILPIIQNLRLGFPSDAMILLRALMERIALLGYLQTNPTFIERYNNSDNKIQAESMKWAKNHLLENWMRLYSVLSNIAHPKIDSLGGYILSKNIISESFQLSMPPIELYSDGINSEIVGMILYGLMAVDSVAANIIGQDYSSFLEPNEELVKYINKKDLAEFSSFTKTLIDKYK